MRTSESLRRRHAITSVTPVPKNASALLLVDADVGVGCEAASSDHSAEDHGAGDDYDDGVGSGVAQPVLLDLGPGDGVLWEGRGGVRRGGGRILGGLETFFVRSRGGSIGFASDRGGKASILPYQVAP